MIIITALWKAHPDKENDLQRHLESMVDHVRQTEPDCLEYILQQNKEDPTEFLLYEQYANHNAIEVHKGTSHFRTLMTNTKGLIGQPVEIKIYNLIV